MSWILILEQLLNGLQFGLMLFLLAAGPAIASVLAYLLLVAVLYFRPRGLFQPRA